MRISICFRRNEIIYRLVWLNEDKRGFYVGLLGGQEKYHHSYHRDGTRHDKRNSQVYNEFKGAQLTSHTGIKHITHLSLAMTKEWFSAATAYSSDEKTETLILLDEDLFRGLDTCALDVWLLDRASQYEFFSMIGRPVSSEKTFRIITEVVVSLDNYPNLKLGIIFQSAKIRDLKS